MNLETIAALRKQQKQYFESGKTIPLENRRQALLNLKQAIQKNEARIEAALYEDLGKNSTESYMTEIGMVYEEIRFMLRHLGSFSSAHYHWTPLHEFPALSLTQPVPYGNTLILSPWNYPFNLGMVPLVDALAAGNTVMLKPGHYAENTMRIIEEIISSTFDPGYVCVIDGGREEISALLDLPFDFIFFTGGKTLGRKVMAKASEHLCPVVLELGGKSPVVVDESANLALAAKRIVFGKFLNAGQTCVAPDYVLVHESVKKPFLALLEHEIRKQYPDPSQIGKIIDRKHYNRLIGLIDPEKVVCGGEASESTLQISPTVLRDVTWQDPVMEDEIFGPILPVMGYTDFRQTMRDIASRPTPLAFYLFTRTPLHKNYYREVQPFGGGCINDTIVQLASDHLPFGGMGASGMGHYHGKYGFDAFSHTKAIVEKAQWLDLPVRYNNRAGWMDSLIRKLMK